MKRFSLAKRERITRTAEFRTSLKKSVFSSGRSVKIGVSPNGLDHSRIGVSLRKENFRLSVTRNKLKRHIKEIFRLNKDGFSKGYDIIFIARAPAAKMDYRQLEADLLGVASKARVYRNDR
jgi:ribonuclease P protein component